MLGQLQDAGNTTTLAHYLDLLAGVGMLVGLQTYSNAPVRRRGSSPKLQVYNTALMTAICGLNLKEDQRSSGLFVFIRVHSWSSSVNDRPFPLD